jgi:hypothetical protein
MRETMKHIMSDDVQDDEDEYLKDMLARRNTIRRAKPNKEYNIDDVAMSSHDQADQDLDKAYLEKETPQSFEATPAMTFVIIITLISIFCFAVMAGVTYLIRKEAYEIVGVGLLISRGAALSILVLDIFALTFVSYDLLTMCRSYKCTRRCVTLLDFNVYFHKI